MRLYRERYQPHVPGVPLNGPSAHLAEATVEMRFQFRYAAEQPSRLLTLDPQTLWFSAAGLTPAKTAARAKVVQHDASKALGTLG